MSPTRTRSEKAALGAMIAGAVAIVVGLLVIFLGGSSSSGDQPSAEPPRSTTGPVQEFDGRTQEQRARDKRAADQQKALDALTTAGDGSGGSDDPFASSDGDRTRHEVRVTFTADGSLYAGYRFRNGGEGIKVASSSLTIDRTVRGPLPVAQVAVQVLENSTYATCSIEIDGVVVNTQTARGKNHVVICMS